MRAGGAGGAIAVAEAGVAAGGEVGFAGAVTGAEVCDVWETLAAGDESASWHHQHHQRRVHALRRLSAVERSHHCRVVLPAGPVQFDQVTWDR